MKYEEIGCFRNMTLSQVTKKVWREQLRKSFFFLMSKSNYTLLRTLMMYTIYFSFSPLFARYAACLLQFRWAMEKRTINKWVSIKSIRRFWITCNDISLPELRTWTCFPVTSVSRAASTAVRANSIGALRLHMTDGRRGGAFINICVKK